MTQLFAELPDVMTVEQMAKALHIGRTLAYRLVQSGQVRCLRLGTAIRIPKTALLAVVSVDGKEGAAR